MGADTIETSDGVFRKIADWQSTPVSEREPRPVTLDMGLTVFLGGAGMVGDYNGDMVEALTEAGIHNPVYGNYSSLGEVVEPYVPGLVDMLGDAAAVVLYNQDESDPIVYEYSDVGGCTLGEEIEQRKFLFGLITVTKYDTIACEPPSTPLAMRISRDVEQVKESDFSLPRIGISEPLPSFGQFNFIGYSWGAVIAARSAIFHAEKGLTINHLVLIGAPINKSLKDAVMQHPNILNTHIIDLRGYGDPIYAGMTDEEIVNSSLELARQMRSGEGHFYYSPSDDIGKRRRRTLVQRLYGLGLR